MTFRCSDCQTFTKHVSVSAAEVHKAMGYDNVFSLMFGRLSDLMPGVTSTAGTPYVCSRCKLFRFEGGIMSDHENEKVKKLGLRMK